jgi:hypothetical protein
VQLGNTQRGRRLGTGATATEPPPPPPSHRATAPPSHRHRAIGRLTLTGLTQVPNVLLAQRLFGDPDYLLRIVTADLAAYQ